MQEFEGKAALITGASRGIGRAIALALARRGARVAAAARDAAGLDGLREEAARVGADILPVPLDLSLAAAPGEAVARTVEALGGLSILVNNAGATRGGNFLKLTEEDWASGFGLKFFGAVRATRAAWPHLAASGGCVVNIGGVGGRVANATYTIGGSVNAAMMNLTKALADRGVTDGVRVNLVNPGNVSTDRLQGRIASVMRKSGVDAEEAARHVAAEAGVLRFAEASEIAEVVAFLCSTGASYMQGALVDVDGGWVRAV